jgi:EAL domain-containing protein (putative c-di-GMP-specific phosphodiesterase class I)
MSYHDQGHSLPRITINLSGQSLADPGFLDFLLKTIPTYGKFWEALCFEITETQAISNLISAQNMISTLKSNGCKFALDDFGSGLSSFSYLKDFDVDYLKIDGTFIIDICEDERDRAMIVSIHEMAHALGMKTIAEFAESPAIVSALEEIGIDFIQGYAIGEATPFQDCH